MSHGIFWRGEVDRQRTTLGCETSINHQPLHYIEIIFKIYPDMHWQGEMKVHTTNGCGLVAKVRKYG